MAAAEATLEHGRSKSPVTGWATYQKSPEKSRESQRDALTSGEAPVQVGSILDNLDFYEYGYFRLGKDLLMSKQEHPFASLDDVLLEEEGQISKMGEYDPPCKVSIPFETIPILEKRYFIEFIQDSFH
jgi:hypothetical protein